MVEKPTYEDSLKKGSKQSPEEKKKIFDEYVNGLRKFDGVFVMHDYVDDKGKPIETYSFSKTSLFCLSD